MMQKYGILRDLQKLVIFNELMSKVSVKFVILVFDALELHHDDGLCGYFSTSVLRSYFHRIDNISRKYLELIQILVVFICCRGKIHRAHDCGHLSDVQRT